MNVPGGAADERPGDNYIPENLSGFASGLGSPGPGVETVDIPVPEFDADDAVPSGSSGRAAAVGGSIVTMAVDRGAALGLAYIAHGEPDDFRADEGEYRDLQAAIESFMEQSMMRLSPGVQLFLALASIYGAKLPEALRRRREWEERIWMKGERGEVKGERVEVKGEKVEVKGESGEEDGADE